MSALPSSHYSLEIINILSSKLFDEVEGLWKCFESATNCRINEGGDRNGLVWWETNCSLKCQMSSSEHFVVVSADMNTYL